MKWITNSIGKEQIWYSKDVIDKIIECESLKNWRNTAIKHIKELVVYKNTQLGRSTQNGIEGLTILNEVMENADF